MDRSLDEIISERPKGRPTRSEPRRGPPPSGPSRAPRREEYPRDGVRKPRRDEQVNFDSDWVHDRFDDADGHDRNRQRRPGPDRHGGGGRETDSTGSKIRVDNLHYDLTEEDLRDLFGRVGRLVSCKLLYDRMDRSEGTAFVTYEDPRDARDAVTEFNGQNAYGQPIRLSLVPSGPVGKSGASLFDRVDRPSRSLFDRIEGGPPGGHDDGRERRRNRSDSPRKRGGAPENVDRYVPGVRGSRSPIRRRGTPREAGRRPGQRREGAGRRGGGRPKADEDGHRIVGGRPRKTAEELDAEMADYWGSKGKEGNGAGATATTKVAVAATGDDVDMIE